MVSPAAFEKSLRAGKFKLITRKQQANAQKRARGRRDAAIRADLDYLRSQSANAHNEKLDALLERASTASNLHTEPVLKLSGKQSVRLLSLAQEISSAAAAHRAAQDPKALLATYKHSYGLLTQEQRDGLPTPKSLAEAHAETVRAAILQLDEMLLALPFPDGAISLREPRGGSAIPRTAPIPGNGTPPNCTRGGAGLYDATAWPLKRHLTPVRNQGRRGMCWAFSAVGAVESRELVLAGRTVDLSEQFLVNKVKALYDEDDYSDGHNAEEALDDLFDNRQTLPPESYWTYNTSPMRSTSGGANAAGHAGACNGYTGSCSPTSHQSPQFCTSTFSPPMNFCSDYRTITYTQAGTPSSFTIEVWDGSGALPLARIRRELSNGVALMASFGVRAGFDSPQNGFVTDFRDGYFQDGTFKSGSRGDHQVLIVGYVSEAEVRAGIRNGTVILPGVDPAIGGQGIPDFLAGTFIPGGFPLGVNGYFIVKNSWGCSGDGGYYYVPDSYVQRYFNRISSLSFTFQRSPVWQQQAFLAKSGNTVAELGVPVNLFSAAPPPAGTLSLLQVQATSSNAGDRIDLGSSIFGTNLYGSTFQTTGPRTITVRVSYPGVPGELMDSFVINVVDTPPKVQFYNLPTRALRVGEPVQLAIFVSDARGNPALNLCPSARYTVDGILSGQGFCEVRVSFAAPGVREVTASVTSSTGRVGVATYRPTVLPATDNPFRVVSAGLSRAPRSTSVDSCSRATAVPNDTEIDLGSNITTCDGAINQSPFIASAVVENPRGETLDYAWTFWVNTPDTVLQRATDSRFGIGAERFGTGGTFACGVTLVVTPQDRDGTTSLPVVWRGTCRLAAFSPS